MGFCWFEPNQTKPNLWHSNINLRVEISHKNVFRGAFSSIPEKFKYWAQFWTIKSQNLSRQQFFGITKNLGKRFHFGSAEPAQPNRIKPGFGRSLMGARGRKTEDILRPYILDTPLAIATAKKPCKEEREKVSEANYVTCRKSVNIEKGLFCWTYLYSRKCRCTSDKLHDDNNNVHTAKLGSESISFITSTLGTWYQEG